MPGIKLIKTMTDREKLKEKLVYINKARKIIPYHHLIESGIYNRRVNEADKLVKRILRKEL